MTAQVWLQQTHRQLRIALSGQRATVVHGQGKIIWIELAGLLEQSPGLLPIALGQRDFRRLDAEGQPIGIAADQTRRLLSGLVIAASLTQGQRVGIARGGLIGCIAPWPAGFPTP